jgi:hypothetical protein
MLFKQTLIKIYHPKIFYLINIAWFTKYSRNATKLIHPELQKYATSLLIPAANQNLNEGKEYILQKPLNNCSIRPSNGWSKGRNNSFLWTDCVWQETNTKSSSGPPTAQKLQPELEVKLREYATDNGIILALNSMSLFRCQLKSVKCGES